MFIGQDSSGAQNSQINVHEILYYNSTTNNISITDSHIWSYLSSRWTITSYTDAYNALPPVPTSYYSTYSTGQRSGIIGVSASGIVLGAGHSPTNWINGIVSTSTGRWYPESGVGAGYVQFDLAEAKIFDGLKFIRDRLYNTGTAYLNLTASNDGSTWTTLKSNFAWNENEIQQTTLTVTDTGFTSGYLAFVSTSEWSNSIAYTKYRLTFISGSVGIGWENEILFRSN
jgi:hypothetical protein